MSMDFSRIWKIPLAVLVVLCVLGGIAYGIDRWVNAPDPHAGQRCVQSHDETWLMPISVGKTVTLIPEVESVCDKWVPNGK